MIDLRDPRQFERAYREHRPRALSAAIGVLRDSAAAEDVVQDVFAQLWRRPAAFDQSRGSLRTYVTMLARSRAVDRWRARAAREGALERLAADPAEARERHAESPADLTERRREAVDALAALEAVSSEQREAVLLAFGRELTAREIATAMGVPIGTAKSRVRLGLEKARIGLREAA